jgi:hypothetical protein
MTPVATGISRKGCGAVMALAAVFSLPERRHGKIIFLFNLTGLFGEEARVTVLAVKFLAEMEFMFKNHRSDRFNENYRPAAVFLGFA